MEPSLVPISQQAAVVGPPVRPFAFLAGLVVGQFCLAVLQGLGQVSHAPSEGTQQGVGRAGVPLKGAAFREHVEVGQALDDAQDLVAGAGRVHQLVGATERSQRLLHHLLLAGAQHHGRPSVQDIFRAGLRAGVDVTVRHAPEVPAAPAVNVDNLQRVQGFTLGKKEPVILQINDGFISFLQLLAPLRRSISTDANSFFIANRTSDTVYGASFSAYLHNGSYKSTFI